MRIRSAVLLLVLAGSLPAAERRFISATEQEQRLLSSPGDYTLPEEFDAPMETVQLKAVIDAEGKVVKAKEYDWNRAPRSLVENAKRQVKSWRYRPLKVGDKLVEVITIIRIPYWKRRTSVQALRGNSQ